MDIGALETQFSFLNLSETGEVSFNFSFSWKLLFRRAMCCWIEVAGALNFLETTGDVSTFSSWSTEKLSGFSRSILSNTVKPNKSI